MRMPEALRASGVDEKKLARVLHKMLEDEHCTPADRRWAAEECLKLLAAYPSPRAADAPVHIVVDLPAPHRDGTGPAAERNANEEAGASAAMPAPTGDAAE